MDRSGGIYVKPGGWYNVWEFVKSFLLLAILGILIGILVCLCQTKNIADDIHGVVKMLEQLGPCLAAEFCPLPIAASQ